MYRLAVCEDEPVLREGTCAMCGEILTGLGVEYEQTAYASAVELQNALSQGREFDLLCLDILMPGKTGLELAMELREWDEKTSILFLTSSTEYLLEGYGARPIQYLLKPVKKEALEKALRTDLRLNHQPKTVTLRAKGKTAVLVLEEIHYVESRDHGCMFYTDQGDQFFWLTLGQVEQLLPPNQFCRCHNSFLINLARIKEAGNRELILDSGKSLVIGRRYAEQFQRSFVRFLNAK